MNRLSTAKRAQIVGMLVEGNSLRSVSRMADCSINTVTKLLVDLGAACAKYHDEHVRNVRAKRIQANEIWCFVGAKEKNVTAEQKAAGWGDIWTWTALDPDSKLMVSYMVGQRNPPMAFALMMDVAERLEGRVQLTTDGLYWYPHAVEKAFGIGVDYAVLTKHYATTSMKAGTTRYSPGYLTGTSTEVIKGTPDAAHISTSHVERQNLTMRMHMRRFTRLTNGFSKKADNHAHAVALHYAYYNFGKVHKSLRVTPAMQAGLSDHVWGLEEIVALLDRPSN